MCDSWPPLLSALSLPGLLSAFEFPLALSALISLPRAPLALSALPRPAHPVLPPFLHSNRYQIPPTSTIKSGPSRPLLLGIPPSISAVSLSLCLPASCLPRICHPHALPPPAPFLSPALLLHLAMPLCPSPHGILREQLWCTVWLPRWGVLLPSHLLSLPRSPSLSLSPLVSLPCISTLPSCLLSLSISLPRSLSLGHSPLVSLPHVSALPSCLLSLLVSLPRSVSLSLSPLCLCLAVSALLSPPHPPASSPSLGLPPSVCLPRSVSLVSLPRCLCLALPPPLPPSVSLPRTVNTCTDNQVGLCLENHDLTLF